MSTVVSLWTPISGLYNFPRRDTDSQYHITTQAPPKAERRIDLRYDSIYEIIHRALAGHSLMRGARSATSKWTRMIESRYIVISNALLYYIGLGNLEDS